MSGASIYFCCNDPGSGNFTGRVPLILIGDDLLELESHRWDPMQNRPTGARLRFGARSFRLLGKTWGPMLSRTGWAASWCWERVELEERTARRFLVWLHGRRLFTAAAGESKLFDAWESDAPLPLEPDSDEPTGLGRLFREAVAPVGRISEAPSADASRPQFASADGASLIRPTGLP